MLALQGVLILIFVFFLHPFEGSGDFYHSVNTGKFILQNHTLPYFDTWTHTANGLPWVAHSWGTGVIFYFLLKNFGPISISIFAAMIAVLTFFLLYKLLRIYNISKWPALTCLLVAVPLVATRWPQRPEILEYPLVLILFIIDSLKQKNHKLVYLYPIIILFWANFYGSSVIFGVGLIGLFSLKQLITDKFKTGRKQILFYLVAAISFLISFVNGYGAKTVFYIFYYIPKVRTYEGEWAGIARIISSMPASQLVITQYYIIIYFVFLALFILLMIFSWKILKDNLFLLILAISIFEPIFIFRNLPLAAILASPIVAKALEYQIKKRRFFVPIILTIFAISAIGVDLWLNKPGIMTTPNKAMEDEITYIKNNNIKGDALNMSAIGAYLTYRLYPNVKVFFDTRDDLFTNTSALSDLYDTFNNDKGVLPLINKYRVNLIVGNYVGDGLNYKDLFYSLDWSLVYFNDGNFVFVLKNIAHEKGLIELAYIDPFSATGAKNGQEKKALPYYKYLFEKYPDSLNNKLLYISILSSLKKNDDVIRIGKDIKIDTLSPIGISMENEKDTVLLDAYLAKNDCVNSKIYLDKVTMTTGSPLIFSHNNVGSPIPYKQLAFYYLICQRDSQKAQQYLQNVLNSPEYNPLQKIEFQREFEDIMRQ